MIIKNFHNKDTVYTDQAGKLPVVCSWGNRLLMVMLNVDANYIDAEPLKDHSDASLTQAYTAMWKRLTASGVIKPTMHILDNKVSPAFKSKFRENCDLQLTPPDTHQRNLAERAIQTFKNHFIAILVGVDKDFPMQLWDRLIPQAVLTVNLLQKASANPAISAYKYINEKHDYSKLPLAPLCCAVQIHEGPARRLKWAPHSVVGWYLGTSKEHYRCHLIFVKKMHSERISDTVVFASVNHETNHHRSRHHSKSIARFDRNLAGKNKS